MKHSLSLVATGLVVALSTQVACGSSAQKKPAAAEQTQTPQTVTSPPTDGDLEKKINAFAEGEGDDAVLAELLRQQPRESLITSAERIREAAEPTDAVRVSVAFLLCRLNHSYPENRTIIVEAFRNPEKYRDFHGDYVVGMLARQIREGDKELLPVTFQAAKAADGASAEGLSSIFIENFRATPNAFLQQLSRMNVGVRREVFELLSHALLTTDDVSSAKTTLASISPESQEHQTAKEMYAFLDQKRKHPN